MLNLYLSVSYITYFSDPLTRIQAIGIRVVNNLGLVRNETDNKNSVLHIIPRQNIVILCQQLHLIRGTLREQLSYLRLAHGLSSVTDDNYAQQLLNEFSLGHLIDRYSMNGKRQVWSELLSIGEQQRLMIVSALLVGTETARLLILDETTSGCDKQTEEAIYKYLQRSNLQFISISHRKEISKYHSRQMTIDATDTPIPTPVFKTRF
ncbi:unnamed protein product [Adineta steineri]|uniref:ABC transporter domain-containing protein n=1 Tax=Adineta steineri TaxID=433720 RepID=A0A813MW61_9BILA|nr:unnamed protein product [Adineta steineri]CAF0847222.1 unnamed protein product [Adineta steineri]